MQGLNIPKFIWIVIAFLVTAITFALFWERDKIFAIFSKGRETIDTTPYVNISGELIDENTGKAVTQKFLIKVEDDITNLEESSYNGMFTLKGVPYDSNSNLKRLILVCADGKQYPNLIPIVNLNNKSLYPVRNGWIFLPPIRLAFPCSTGLPKKKLKKHLQ